ncbi:hypothetical protein GGS23DRAFT_600499 [Durotheca rogersii]|uniref:uncharacterized protein n=1 Tax=Durotheca rogersii TaxID=419775 RepID=UPI00221FDA7A|nr:uncharacterized protein GGS23DRAFT_600499 [Durotheca rogersii]KAI5859375.1 hypothetical protein GGS23DRAFT_600499 [Durotheca rogersii]
MAGHTRASLLAAAAAFCDAFARQAPVDEILGHFAEGDAAAAVAVVEHGHASLAPFLGRAFRGRGGARAYLELVGRLLAYEEMRFDGWVVDAGGQEEEGEDEDEDEGEGGCVAVRGTARFVWRATGQAWRESFAYRLAFAPRGGKLLVYEIWADSGAAYLASRGELPAEEEEGEEKRGGEEEKRGGEEEKGEERE